MISYLLVVEQHRTQIVIHALLKCQQENLYHEQKGNKTTNLTSKEAKMGKVMRHTLGASLNIRHNLSSSKGPKPLQLKLLTTYIPKTSAFTLAFSRSEERFSRNAETDLVCRLLLEKKKLFVIIFSITLVYFCSLRHLN